MKSRYACKAVGTNRIQAGSIGGQFWVDCSNVPFSLARAIFSGTHHRETYQLKRGESAGSLATA